MINSPKTDRDILTRQAYATDDHLSTRIRIHDQYSVPRINFADWVLSRVQWRGDETVLDVGSGPGGYFAETWARIPNGRLIAGDLSFGMARQAAKHPKAGAVLNADVQHLPFPDDSFDVVLANHMLFHVPDLDTALTEIHRVLKPTGLMVASTNSTYNMPELDQLVRRAYGLLGARGVEPESDPVTGFSLEDGAMYAARHFFAVARYDLPGAFVFPTAQPVIDYVNSARAIREPRLPRGILWEDFISVLNDQVQRMISHFGELVISKLSGVIVASEMGGFAENYIQTLLNPPPPAE
jgi:SAM-dependent methyltransferase